MTTTSTTLYFDQDQRNVILYRTPSFGADVTLNHKNSCSIEAEDIRPHLSILPELLVNYSFQTSNLTWSLKSSIRGGANPSLLIYPTSLKNIVTKIESVSVAFGSLQFTLPVERLFCSEHFCELLEGMTISEGWGSTTASEITLEQKYPSAVYATLVNFLNAKTQLLRTKVLTTAPLSTFTPLLKLASEWTIPALTTEMGKRIASMKIEANNYVQILDAAITAKLDQPKRAALEYIQENDLHYCLCIAVNQNLAAAAKELAKKDEGLWYKHNQCQAIKTAISFKNVEITKNLLKHAKFDETHAKLLIERAIESKDPNILEAVLIKVTKDFANKIDSWLDMESLLKHQKPHLWLTVRKVCPQYLNLKEDDVKKRVLTEGRIPWITEFFQLEFYENDKTILHYVISKDILLELEKMNVNVSELLNEKHDGLTPLARAIKRESSDMAIALLEAHQKCNVSIDPKAFHFTHLKEVADWIVKNGSDQQKNALLEWAIFQRENGIRPDIAYAMLEAKANPNLTCDKKSILDQLIATHLFDMGKYLLPKVNDDVKTGAIQTALNGGRWDWITWILDQKFGFGWKDNEGQTLLHKVAIRLSDLVKLERNVVFKKPFNAQEKLTQQLLDPEVSVKKIAQPASLKNTLLEKIGEERELLLKAKDTLWERINAFRRMDKHGKSAFDLATHCKEIFDTNDPNKCTQQ